MKFLSRLTGGLFFAAILSATAFGQGSCQPDFMVLLDTGRPANGATVRVCNAGGTFPGCSASLSLFTDPTLSVGASNPGTTDSRGNFGFCAAAGANYDVQVSGSGLTTFTVKNMPLTPTSPITAAALTSASANPANVGLIKMASTDCLDWRNNANSGNIQLCKTGAAGGVPADTLDATAFGGIETPLLTATDSTGFTIGAITNKQRVIFVPGNVGFEYEFLTSANAIAGVEIAGVDAFETSGSVGGAAGHGGLWPNSITHFWAAKNNNGSAYNLVGDSTTQTLTNKTLTSPTITGTAPFNRLRANQGTALVAGDFAISGGWGTTAAIGSILGTDSAFSFVVTSNGTGQATGPTVTVTFHDGTWTNSPLCVTNMGPGNSGLAAWIISSVSATQLVLQGTQVSTNFTPVAANTYGATVVCFGR